MQQEYEALLKKFVEIPSVSADPNHKQDIIRMAETAVETIKSFGGNAEIIQTNGNPVVIGEIKQNETYPTITLYNHLDVQPAAGPEWKTPPFTLTKIGEICYARGATDDKGPALAALFAAREAFRKKIPINIKIIWELEEEIGSEHFEQFVIANKEKLQTNSIVVSDTEWISRERPAVPYGLRGLVALRLHLETAEGDVHSGSAGGVARNPIGELCNVITQCYNPTTGKVKIPGFYEDILPLNADEMKNFKRSGFELEHFKTALKLKSTRKTTKLAAMKKLWAQPTFEVHGIVGGYTGPGDKTIIPPRAEAKITMRLVPNQKPEKIAKIVTEYIKSINPDVRVEPGHSCEPYLGEFTGPYADAARNAIKQSFGKEPSFIREGGSIGAVLTMKKHLGVPVVLLGLSLPEQGYHAPNENFDWQQANRGIQLFTKYFEEISYPSER